MKEINAILEPDGTYHIYNRANGSERLFLSDENYYFFLKRYRKFIVPFADTFCYCLMPNHFHFLIKIKNEASVNEAFIKLKEERTSKNITHKSMRTTSPKSQNFGSEVSPNHPTSAASTFSDGVIPKPEEIIKKQFSNLFSSYTQAFNKQNNRKGSLFMKRFKRRLVNSDEYCKKLIHYIHYNPVEAGLCHQPEQWRYSSYRAILSNSNSDIKRNAVLELFENRQNFIYCHQQPPDISGIE